MSNIRRIIKVFIASPGGLENERRAAREVVDEINLTSSAFLGVQLELVGWEVTLPRYGRPQEQINNDLRQCEYFMGILWDHFGSHRPSSDMTFESGFHEEFELAKKLRADGKKMEITQLFKDVEERAQDPGPKLQRVLDFKREITEVRTLLFQNFSSLDEFKSCVRRILLNYAQQQSPLSTEINSRVDGDRTRRKEGPKDAASPEKMDGQSIFDSEAQQFLAPLVERHGDYDSLLPREVARFRLLASSLTRGGNDELVLGAHDANILFVARDALNWSGREYHALVKCGIKSLEHANIPLWYWLTKLGKPMSEQLSIRTFGGDESAANAIDALRLLGGPVDNLGEQITRDWIIKSWFGEKASEAGKLAGLRYLAEQGSRDDSDTINSLSEALSSDRVKRAAAETKILLAGRDGGNAGLEALFDIDPPILSKKFVTTVDQWLTNADDTRLIEGLRLANDDLRLLSTQELTHRNALPTEQAKVLLTDANAKTRRLALERLEESGVSFSDEQVKNALVRPRKQTIGLLSFTQGASSQSSDTEGEAEYEDYRIESLKVRSDHELQEVIDRDWAFDLKAQLVLWRKRFNAEKEVIKVAILDKFADHYDQHRARLEEIDPMLEQAFTAFQRFVAQYRTSATQRAFDMLCEEASASEISFVRKVIDSTEIGFSLAAVIYLKRQGDWSDIARILKLTERRFTIGRTILSMHDDTIEFEAAADAILKLSVGRTGDLLSLDMDQKIFTKIVAKLNEKAFRRLSNDEIEQIFLDKSESKRKAIVLGCVIDLTKTRLKELQERHDATESGRYYNVAHWLDFGISLPRPVARRGAQEILNDLAS